MFASAVRSGGSSVSTGGRVLSPEEVKAGLSKLKNSLLVEPTGLVEGKNGEASYDPRSILQISKALHTLASAQGESFLSGQLFGPERTMLARVLLGKADGYTLAWWQHEDAEASYLSNSSHLPGSEYVTTQGQAHTRVLYNQRNSSIDLYHPSVVRAYDRQFGPAYPRY